MTGKPTAVPSCAQRRTVISQRNRSARTGRVLRDDLAYHTECDTIDYVPLLALYTAVSTIQQAVHSVEERAYPFVEG